ncbi:flavin reductase [Cereibacter changlensis JA139]|uniref:Flavin reductase n=2 Tax=Cereibacter changlensis TaxID=402884 RepID=A0A2T4JT46_9RHOB|nr:flavin reductase family protein [Cereibacter changlensis]PTE21079.1 flavin reductase [Cereibacter changlensis JA139]
MTATEKTNIGSAEFREAMCRHAAGVALVTTRTVDGRPLGMLATAVTSVTADPPTILVCINSGASMHADVSRGGVFAVNFLAESHRRIADRFASPEARDQRFQSGDWGIAETGSPVLMGAMAVLDCQVGQIEEVGTHSVLFGRVVETVIGTEVDYSPMVYFERRYRALSGSRL